MKEVNPKSNQGQNKKNPKKIIVRPSSFSKSDLHPSNEISNQEFSDFIEIVKSNISKIDLVHIDPGRLNDSDKEFFSGKVLYDSINADYVVLDDLANTGLTKVDQKDSKTKFGIYRKIKSNEDISKMKKDLDANNLSFVIIQLADWRIIPLENIIASLQSKNVEIFAIATSIGEVNTLFNILELGVDGVLISPSSTNEISEVSDLILSSTLQIQIAEIKEVMDVGMGERVCIDTVSMLDYGEGMLVGNRSNFLFLIHNESIGSSFTSPRPFRVNAGAVHCYTLVPDGNTKYLSELESGSQVLIVNNTGAVRKVVVGRSKIESRPLRLFKASINEKEYGSIIVQNAETIRFVDPDGNLIPVTHIKPDDKIMVYSLEPTGRHFGMQVSDEYILEK